MNGIGKVKIKKEARNRLSVLRKIEAILAKNKLLIGWDGDGFVVQDIDQAKDVLGFKSIQKEIK